MTIIGVRCLCTAHTRNGHRDRSYRGVLIPPVLEKYLPELSGHAHALHLPDRASVGNILAASGGEDFILGMLDECSAVAAASLLSVVPAKFRDARDNALVLRFPL